MGARSALRLLTGGLRAANFRGCLNALASAIEPWRAAPTGERTRGNCWQSGVSTQLALARLSLESTATFLSFFRASAPQLSRKFRKSFSFTHTLPTHNAPCGSSDLPCGFARRARTYRCTHPGRKNLSLAPGRYANLPKNLSLGPGPVRSYHPLQTVIDGQTFSR